MVMLVVSASSCILIFKPWLERCSEPRMKSGEGLDYWSPKDNQTGLEETIYVRHVVWHLINDE